jgi:tetratricopeptide (TPR) repeat protein
VTRAFEEPLQRAIELFNAGRYPEAAVLFRRCVTLGAGAAVSVYLDHIRHYLARGPLDAIEPYAALIERGRYALAVPAAELAFRENPSRAYRRFRDIWLNSSFKNLAKAPKSPWIAFFRSSQAWTALDDLKALSLLHEASAGSRERAWMRYFSAEILLRRAKLFDLADEEIREVVAACPWLWEARCLAAEIGLALGRGDGVADLESVAVEGDSEGAFLAWRGVLKLWSGAYDAALEDLSRAETLGQHDSQCWGGGALAMLGRLDEALLKLSALLKRDPADQEAAVLRAEVLRRLGRPREALEDLDRLLARVPEHPWALVNRALCSLALGEEAEARRDYLRLLYGAKPPKLNVPPETMRARLDEVLEKARGCRRGDAHLNIGWMRAAGVKTPRRPGGEARLRPWFEARGAAAPAPARRGRAAAEGLDEAKARKALGRA